MKYKISWPIGLSILIVLLISLFSYLNIKDKGLSLAVYADIEKIKLEGIVDTPIKYATERKILTAIYRKKHTGDCDFEKLGVETCIKIIPKLIVLHMTALDSLEKSLETLYAPFLKERDNLLERSNGDNLNISAHFLIDIDGTIYNLMPETYMARSAIGVNHLSIAIENVGFFPSKEQVLASTRLVKYLLKKYETIKGIIAHTELKKLKETKHPFFVEKEQKYFETKYCGLEITRLIREKLSFKQIFVR